MISWGYGLKEIRVEIDGKEKHMKFMNEKIIDIKITGQQLELSWCDSWSNWEELQGNEELLQLIEKCNDRLKNSKGQGKGKVKTAS